MLRVHTTERLDCIPVFRRNRLSNPWQCLLLALALPFALRGEDEEPAADPRHWLAATNAPERRCEAAAYFRQHPAEIGAPEREALRSMLADARRVTLAQDGFSAGLPSTPGAEARKALEKAGKTVEDMKLIIPHQANQRIISAIGDRLGGRPDQYYINLDRYGNTSAASIILALDEAVRGGRLERGDQVLLVAFGGGFTWGATVFEW